MAPLYLPRKYKRNEFIKQILQKKKKKKETATTKRQKNKLIIINNGAMHTIKECRKYLKKWNFEYSVKFALIGFRKTD